MIHLCFRGTCWALVHGLRPVLQLGAQQQQALWQRSVRWMSIPCTSHMLHINGCSNAKGSVDVAMSCVAACWRETEAATVGNATMQHPIATLQQVKQSQIISYVTHVVPDSPRPCCQALIARLRPCLCCLHTVAPVSECHPSTTEGSTTAWGILHSSHTGVGALCKHQGPSMGCLWLHSLRYPCLLRGAHPPPPTQGG